MHVLFTLLIVLLPAGLLWLTHQQDWARKVGIIGLCYVAGLAFGNLGLIPGKFQPAQQLITDCSIALALPLLLFSLDIRQWSQVAGKAILSMFLASTAVTAIATVLFILFREQGSETASHFAAMSVGVYTGGTPNLAAIKTGLEIPDSEYLVFHSLDTVFGAVYLAVMLTVGVPIFRTLLKRPAPGQAGSTEEMSHLIGDDLTPLLDLQNLPELLKAAALSLLVVAAAIGVSELVPRLLPVGKSDATVIILLTTLGIGLSLVPAVRGLKLSYMLGMYLIYVFCFTVASQATLEQLAQVDVGVVVFVTVAVVGSLILHCLFCWFAGIDSDTFMVTSVAAICSPPFVPMMAKVLDNPATILSGMTTGIIGYALGNYLGISLGLLLQRW